MVYQGKKSTQLTILVSVCLYSRLQLGMKFCLSVEKSDILLNSAAETVLLFHYLVSDFSGCV